MSDYKDKRGADPVIAKQGIPYICSLYGDPAKATVVDDQITMHTPLPRAYPAAWVSTAGAWSLVNFETESVGRIVGEVFCESYVTIATRHC